MASPNKRYRDFHIGDVFRFTRTITSQDVDAFAELTGDVNPLHLDEVHAHEMGFEGRIAHGMLVSSLFSTLVGMHCPGMSGFYVSQTLAFRHPVYCGNMLTVQGEIIEKNDAIRLLTLKTEVLSGDRVVVSGEAKVSVSEHD